MTLHVSSDASYLTAPKAGSRTAGYHYLSSKPTNPTKPPLPMDPEPPNNGAIHVPCHIMREVLSSAAKAKLAGVFHNGKEACALHAYLTKLSQPQPPAPIQIDNSTAAGIANDSIKQKCSKAMDMHFYWIQTRSTEANFLSTGKKAAQTTPNILPSSIIPHRIIKPFVHSICICLMIGQNTILHASKIRIVPKSKMPLKLQSLLHPLRKSNAVRVC
jgi:hypothetical protein